MSEVQEFGAWEYARTPLCARQQARRALLDVWRAPGPEIPHGPLRSHARDEPGTPPGPENSSPDPATGSGSSWTA